MGQTDEFTASLLTARQSAGRPGCYESDLDLDYIGKDR